MVEHLSNLLHLFVIELIVGEVNLINTVVLLEPLQDEVKCGRFFGKQL